MNLFYQACRPVMAGLLWALADFHLEGAEKMPRDGALIVVSNHIHFVDPPLLGGVLPRYIRFMAKTEAFKAPWGLMFTTAYGAFPVRRGEIDRKALRQAEAILRNGGAIGMFPEGHRSHGSGLQAGFGGAAFIARRTGAPLLPVAVWGTEAAFRQRPRWPITVRVGDPFHTARAATREASTDEIMCRIEALLPPSYRRPSTPQGAQV